jgi:hypothetical protein
MRELIFSVFGGCVMTSSGRCLGLRGHHGWQWSPSNLHLDLATACHDRSLHRLRQRIRVVGPPIRSPRNSDSKTCHRRICWHRHGRAHRRPCATEEPTPTLLMWPAGLALSPPLLTRLSLLRHSIENKEEEKMMEGFLTRAAFCS